MLCVKSLLYSNTWTSGFPLSWLGGMRASSFNESLAEFWKCCPWPPWWLSSPCRAIHSYGSSQSNSAMARACAGFWGPTEMNQKTPHLPPHRAPPSGSPGSGSPGCAWQMESPGLSVPFSQGVLFHGQNTIDACLLRMQC